MVTRKILGWLIVAVLAFGPMWFPPDASAASLRSATSGWFKAGNSVRPARANDLVIIDALELTEDDVDPACASGNYNIYADASETVIKVCQDGVSNVIGLGGMSQWTDTGTVIHPAELTDDMSLGSATLINGAKSSIDGDDDQVQFAIQGNATQTTNLIEHENSAGTVLYSLDNIGIESVFGGVEFLDDDTDPACAAGNYNIFADLSETALKMCNNGTTTVIATGASVTESEFTAGWNVGAASFLQSEDVSTQAPSPVGVFFKPDGLKMYVLAGDEDINEYDLSVAWDVTTTTFLQLGSIVAQGTSAGGMFIRDDGLRVYTVDVNAREISEWDLSPAWDISSISFSRDIDISGQGLSPSGVFLRDDGLKAYVSDFNDTEVNEYDLSVAWDITSALFLQLLDVSTEEATPQDLFLKSDGTKLFIVGSGGDEVNEYDLSAAWDITTATASQVFDVTGETLIPQGMFIRISDGVKMYIGDATNGSIIEYDLGFFLDNNTTITGTTHAKVATDGDSVLAILENSEPHAAASTNETAQLRFGFGGDLDVARIVVGKEDDYDPGAGENDSFMAFYTDLSGTATEAGRFTSDTNFLIPDNGGLVVGHTAQIDFGAISEFQVLGTSTVDSSMGFARFQTNASGPDIRFLKSRDAVIGSNTIVVDGDTLGRIRAQGDDGGDYNTPATEIAFEVDGVPGANDMPGRIVFSTTPDGTSAVAEVMRLTSAGDAEIADGGGIVVGHNAQITTTGNPSELQVLGTGSGDAVATFGRFSADISAPGIHFVKSRNATIGSNTILVDNDKVGALEFYPDDGVDHQTVAARFRAEVDDATPAAGDIGMAFTWEQMPGGGGALAETMRLSATALTMRNATHIALDTNAGITASTTQTQGFGALTAQINEIDTVAFTDDTVTLPTAVTGVEIEIINNGASTLQIFPASGDDLGLGANISEQLEANERVKFVAYDTTNWAKESTTEIIHAEMHDEDNTDAFVVNDAGADFHSYHTNGLAAGDLADWTFDAGGGGTSFPIASIADSGANILVTTTGTHGLAVGDIVSQTNLTDGNYVGIFEILTAPTTTTYTVGPVTFTATGTGTMDQAATITADAVAAGVYSFSYFISATSATNNETFDFQLQKGAAAVVGSKVRRKFGTAADFGSMSGGGVVFVGDGDKISFALSNEDSAGNITIRNITMVFVRL